MQREDVTLSPDYSQNWVHWADPDADDNVLDDNNDFDEVFADDDDNNVFDNKRYYSEKCNVLFACMHCWSLIFIAFRFSLCCKVSFLWKHAMSNLLLTFFPIPKMILTWSLDHWSMVDYLSENWDFRCSATQLNT